MGLSYRRLTDRAGNAEVHHLDQAGVGDHDVCRLYVAVNHSGLVRELKSREHSLGVSECLGNRQGTLMNQVTKQSAAHVFHDDVGRASFVAVGVGGDFFTGVINANDGWVRHSSGCLRLLLEPSLKAWVVGEVRLEQLNGDLAAEPVVDSFVNIGHSAAADQAAHGISVGEDSLLFGQVSYSAVLVVSLSLRVCRDVGKGYVVDHRDACALNYLAKWARVIDREESNIVVCHL